MKMVKSLLLGSAAALVAVTAGQAADLPVKAKPVEYVKVCSLYGAGFYYMPGTDMCIKIGGWVRAEATWGNVNGNMTWGPSRRQRQQPVPPATCVRGTAATSRPMLASRPLTARPAPISTSALPPTTPALRSASIVQLEPRLRAVGGHHGRSVAVVLSTSTAAPALLYRAGNLPHEDTGDGGWWVWGYTAQFGGGFSALCRPKSAVHPRSSTSAALRRCAPA